MEKYLILKKTAIDVKEIIEGILNRTSIIGWNYGYRLPDFYSPGLFIGSTGIAYQLLRVLDKKTPSILSLD